VGPIVRIRDAAAESELRVGSIQPELAAHIAPLFSAERCLRDCTLPLKSDAFGLK